MASDEPARVLSEFLRMQAGAAVVRLQDPDLSGAVFTGTFISPQGHILTAHHALAALAESDSTETFELVLEFDPAWFPSREAPPPVSVTAVCRPGWRDEVRDYAVLQVDHRPRAYLPVSPPLSIKDTLGERLRAYGFTDSDRASPCLGEVEGSFLRNLSDRKRFRMRGVVTGAGHSGGPVIFMPTRSIIGSVVGYVADEIQTGDAATVSLADLGSDFGVDFEALEREWRMGAARYLCDHQSQFRALAKGPRVPELPLTHLSGRPKVGEVLAAAAGPHPVLLHGAPGSGKSTLALEAASRLVAEESVRTVFWYDFSRAENLSSQRLLRSLGLHLLRYDGDFELVESYPREASRTDDERATDLVCASLAAQNHCLVFDNIHVLRQHDRADLIQMLGRFAEVAADGAATILYASWAGWDLPGDCTVVEVGGLEPAEVSALLRLYGIEPSVEAFRYVAEYRRDITAVELLVRFRDLSGRVADTPIVEPPELHEYWLRKYRDGLHGNARRLLLALAVLAGPATEELIEAVADIDDFRSTLSELSVSPPLVAADLRESETVYSLHHNVRRALLATSDRRDIAAAHRRAADVLAASSGEELVAARHRLGCGEPDAALELLYRRRDEIIANGKAEGLKLFVLELSDRVSRSAVALLRLNVILGTCSTVRGNYAEATTRWTAALNLTDDPADKSALHLRRGDSMRMASDYDAARADYLAAQRLLTAGRNSVEGQESGRAHLGLAKLSRLQADYPAASSRYQRAHEAFQVSFDEKGMIEAEFGLGEVGRLRHDWEVSLAGYRNSLERSERARNLERQAYAHWGIAEVSRLSGEPAAAVADHMTGLTLCTDVGDIRSEGWAWLGIGECYRATGELDEAFNAYDLAMQRFQETRSETEVAHVQLAVAEAWRDRGEARLDLYDPPRRLYRSKNLLHCLTLCLLARGFAQLDSDQPKDFASDLKSAVRLAGRRGLDFEIGLANDALRDRRTQFLALNFP